MIHTSLPVRYFCCVFLAILGTVYLTSSALAHPMGNFAICHYARLQADPNDVRIHYVIDMAEIPTLTEKGTLCHGQEGAITAPEQSDYLAARARHANPPHLNRQSPALITRRRRPPNAESLFGLAGRDAVRYAHRDMGRPELSVAHGLERSRCRRQRRGRASRRFRFEH